MVWLKMRTQAKPLYLPLTQNSTTLHFNSFVLPGATTLSSTGSALTPGSCGKMGPRCKAADGASSESTNHAPTVDRRAEPGVAQLSSSVRTLSTKVPRLRKATIARSGSVPAAQTCRMARLDQVSLRPQIPSRLHALFLSKHYLKLRVGAAPETYT